MTEEIKTKHTPGPWEHNDSGLIFGQMTDDDNEAPFVADVIEDEVHAALGLLSPREQANALLIAAAPELLEILESAVTELEHWMLGCDQEDESSQTIIELARAAIAKAKGE